jgi:hypothetical protein
MFRYLPLIGLAVSAACGSREPIPTLNLPPIHTVTEYNKIINILNTVKPPTNNNSVDITSTTTLPINILGRCIKYIKQTKNTITHTIYKQEIIRTILINENTFPNLSYNAQYQLIAHEYLHCKYNIAHDEQEIGLLMSPYADTNNPLTIEQTNQAFMDYIE